MLENVTYEGNNQKKIERFLLAVFTFYEAIMIMVSVKREWDSWLAILLLTGLAISWILHISRFKDYGFRAKFTTFMMQGSIVIYTMYLEDISVILPVFATFVVLSGLYGRSEIVGMTFVSAGFIFFYHGVVVDSIPLQTTGEIVKALFQLGNILFLEILVYLWSKRNSEGSLQLQEAFEELKAVENRKDDFLANVSHEIRTPINTICGMSEIIMREELPFKIKENVQGIQLAGRNLMSVVSDILDFSELQSGKIELEEEAYNITSTINDVINTTMARKSGKRIELIVDCDANIPCALLGDEKKLRRVIMNLVDNAIKFTEEGCVTIVIGFRKESYGINLIITVKDTGIGMDEESVEKLFTSFNQVDASRKRQEGGVGLGLAISHALVKKMGGAMTVNSKLGKGSSIKFVIPQKVLDETPIASIHNRENINVAAYIDMEQFGMAAIRDEYSKNIVHMVEQLKGKCQICRNLAELQRREEKEQFSHVFISIAEYREGRAYFDELALRTKVIVVLDHEDEKYVKNQRLLKIYKPFYILTIVSVLNGLHDTKEVMGQYPILNDKFVTKDTHVLVVDDNRMNIRVIEGLLANYKIRVTIATSGQEALEKIMAADYDFVFMDHMMPEMDGVETLHRIRHKVGTYFQKVPVIALTANAVAGTREMLMAEGFDDFLEKPVERSVLERVLKRNLPEEKIIGRGSFGDYVKPQLESWEKEKLPLVSGSDVTVQEYTKKLPIQEKKEVVETAEVAEEVVSLNELERTLGAKGLDVQKGILYCNGKEQYISVLQGYCEDWNASGTLAEELFKKQNWKDYTIAVHGMKGAMRSIGATALSEIARELECAGKEGRIEYIMEHHGELMEAYKKLFLELREYEWICPPQAEGQQTETEEVGELIALEDGDFDRILKNMEEAMYSWDGESLLAMVLDLQKYQYKGTALKDSIAQVKRKVEMSDYVSAVEMVARLKESLADKEK